MHDLVINVHKAVFWIFQLDLHFMCINTDDSDHIVGGEQLQILA